MRAGPGALREAMCPLRALTVPMELITSANGCITATAVLTWTSALVLSLDSSEVHARAATAIPTMAERFIVRSYPGYIAGALRWRSTPRQDRRCTATESRARFFGLRVPLATPARPHGTR